MLRQREPRSTVLGVRRREGGTEGSAAWVNHGIVWVGRDL